MEDLYHKPIQDRFNHLFDVLKSERFLKMQGLNNEIPFFIFPYPPEQQHDIENMGRQLIKKLDAIGIIVLKINLYDCAINLLKDRGDWDLILQEEQALTKTELLEDLQGPLNPEKHMIPEIARQMEQAPFDILFLSGVGEVFPIIRSHTILENLQSAAKTQPTLMWYPGKYTHTPQGGSSLNLFGRLQDDKYYRAFNILEHQV